MMTEDGKITINFTSKQLVRLSAALLDSVVQYCDRADEIAQLTGPGVVEMLATNKAHRAECIALMELINHEYDRHSVDNPANHGRSCSTLLTPDIRQHAQYVANPVQTPSKP